ncbi:MAG: hypothetical protein OXT67_12745 [Zetaproteobacteria bacterium]|nr:hypothetical protein [Zetaproteobacteria bacterium]
MSTSPSLDQYAMISVDFIGEITLMSTLLHQHDDSFTLESKHLQALAAWMQDRGACFAALNQVFQVGEVLPEEEMTPKVRGYVAYIEARLEGR